jgi:hypothetical protein
MNRQVLYIGESKGIGNGKFNLVQNKTTALMDDNGFVQLDGNDEWRLREEFRNPWCFGWHDLGDEWQEGPE